MDNLNLSSQAVIALIIGFMLVIAGMLLAGCTYGTQNNYATASYANQSNTCQSSTTEKSR